MGRVYNDKIEVVNLQTGDLICTTNGSDLILAGQFWWLIGCLIPGDVDHIVVYIGPEGRCIEAGAKGVSEFIVPNHRWDANQLFKTRRFVDRF